MKTGKNNRFLASILAASMMLTMSPFAFAAADTAEQKEMTTQEQVQPATQNETNANPTVSQTEDQSSEDTNSEALKTKGQSSENTNSEASKTEGQPSEDVKPAGDSGRTGNTEKRCKDRRERVSDCCCPQFGAASARRADGGDGSRGKCSDGCSCGGVDF